MPPAPGNGRLGPRKPKPAPKYTVAVPDAKESTRSRQSTIPTPDQSDRNRTAPQQVRDRAAVAKSVSDSRRKAIAEAHAARPTLASRVPGAVKHIVIDNSATVQGPRVKVITPQQALELAKRGAKVRHLTPAEANDIGATMQASIGGGSTGLTRAARATMQGIVQDPKHSLPATARGFRDSLTGIPSSVVALIVNPQGTAKAAVKDYSRRYGGINQPGGVQKMADRISKEGAAPELLDAATLATGVGSAAGKALTIPAKAGKLGKTLEHVATAERPAKRVSGGKAIPQAKSENLIVAAAQTVRDTRKVTKNQTKVATAQGDVVYHGNFRGESNRRVAHVGSRGAAEERLFHRRANGKKGVAKIKGYVLARDARIADFAGEKGDIMQGHFERGRELAQMSPADYEKHLRENFTSPAQPDLADRVRKIDAEYVALYRRFKDYDAIRYTNDTEDPGSASYLVLNRKALLKAGRGGEGRVDAIAREAAARGEIPAKGRVAARMVAKEKGRDLHEMKREQRVEVDQGTRRNLAGLTKHERGGFKFAMQLGIPGDAKIARATLEKRLKDITEARTAEGVTVPKVLAKSNDEAAVIQRMLGSDLERVFTPRLRKVVEAEQSRERRLAGADPGLDPVQSQLRRYAPQAAHLGIERGDRPVVTERRLTGEEVRRISEPIDDTTRVAAAKAISRHERRAGRKATSDEKRAIRREASRRAAKYDPSPDAIAEKTFYHGTGTKGLSPGRLDTTQTSIESIFGEGVYLTTKPGIARGYAKARGRKTSATAIYAAHVQPKKVLDLEAKADPKFVAVLEKHAENMGYVPYEGVTPEILDAVREAARKPGATNESVFDALRNAVSDHSHTYEKSTGSYSENFSELAGDLRREGWDALTHIGGKRTGHNPHQVVIVLDPSDIMGHGGGNPVSKFEERLHGGPQEAGALPTDRVPSSRPAGALSVRRYENVEVPRVAHETDAEYLRRVKKAAAEAGLERPGYFLSQKRPRGGYGDRAIGGSRAIADPKTYTGALFRTGREDVRPEVFQQGISRNIKRRHNWNRVAQNFEDNTFDWARNSTVSHLLDELDHRGIDPESVALWNPRLYRAERAAREDATDLERTGHGEEPVPQGLGEAVDTSAALLKDLAKRPEDFKKAGWSLIPRAVYDEIHADTRPSGAVARGWDIAKGKQSRVLLGLSPSWLQFQVVSNALLTGMAGTGPVDIVKAQVWWHKLPDEQKAAIEPYIGTGAFHDSISQTKLGAARTRSQKVNEMIDGYRAMKTTPFMQKVGRGNPLDMLFRADAAQNNIFRTAVLYSQVKRDAYKRMGQSTKLMAGAQTRFMHALDLGPQHIMDTIVNDQRALERHAQHVVDFLGDYSTFTAAERRVFQRGVMFYGFLRFSLRFTFLTMPIKHPIMSGVMAQLGRLQVDEVRKILGGDELPFALGKLYFTKDGKLKSIDLSRANPAMNAITNFRGPKDLLGFLPPIVGAVIDQAYAKSGFKQKDWRVEGENQPRTGQQGYGVENRARIFLGQMLSLASLYRTAMAATQPGPKGDDSLLFSPRPTNYVDPQTVASIARSQQNLPASAGGRALQQLVPFIPRNDNAPELAASIRARNGQSSGAAPVSIIAPPSAAPPTREQLEARLRQKMNRGPSNASSEELRLRQKLRQR